MKFKASAAEIQKAERIRKKPSKNWLLVSVVCNLIRKGPWSSSDIKEFEREIQRRKK